MFGRGQLGFKATNGQLRGPSLHVGSGVSGLPQQTILSLKEEPPSSRQQSAKTDLKTEYKRPVQTKTSVGNKYGDSVNGKTLDDVKIKMKT